MYKRKLFYIFDKDIADTIDGFFLKKSNQNYGNCSKKQKYYYRGSDLYIHNNEN